MVGGLGIFGTVSFIDPQTGDATSMYYSFVCILVSMVIGFLLTYIFWRDHSAADADVKVSEASGTGKVPAEKISEAQSETAAAKTEEVLGAPMSGEVIPLNELADDAFSSGVMGKGVGIEPTDGKVISPVNGTVSTLFPTLHAIGLTSDSGAEILIHIGMDTVQLEGNGFKAYIAQGDRVQKGQHLLDVDLQLLEERGYVTQTPVLIVNPDDVKEIKMKEKEL